jgi:hypothetical protein
MDRAGIAELAALGGELVTPAFLAWLDILGDPVRATTYRMPVVPTGTGDPELDGFSFTPVNPDLVSVSPVQFREGGADTVTASLSGLVGPDVGLLTTMADPANWRGRVARLWLGVETSPAMLGLWGYFTGYMVSLDIQGSASGQTIVVSIEGYLAALAPASNRTYLVQDEFDPDDRSAAATIACANGIAGSGVTQAFGSGGGGGGPAFNEYKQL